MSVDLEPGWPAAAGTTFFLSADEGGGIDGGGGIVITGALVLSGMGGTGGTASEVNLSVWRDQVESTEGLLLCVWLLKASAPKTAVAGDDVPSWPKVPIDVARVGCVSATAEDDKVVLSSQALLGGFQRRRSCDRLPLLLLQEELPGLVVRLTRRLLQLDGWSRSVTSTASLTRLCRSRCPSSPRS